MAERVLGREAVGQGGGTGVTFHLKTDATSRPMNPKCYIDYLKHLYGMEAVQHNQGRILVMTEPEGEHLVRPSLKHGLLGTMMSAYNGHRHLVLRPDDIWLAITAALSLYVNNHAEQMRHNFVSFDDKKKLVVEVGGAMETADWNYIMGLMSELIDKNTKSGTRDWMEPEFSTTTPTCRTVGRIAMMGVLQKYFSYEVCFMCGIPKVTLEGTLEDWEKLRTKAAHLKSFDVECLTRWAGLLDYVLTKLVESYQGKVDVEFWSHICTEPSWGSGPEYFGGWATVFIPFHHKSGGYILDEADPPNNKWGKINMSHIPAGAVEVPVKLNDNGVEYDTIFYGGHLVTIHDPANDTLRPSVDWLIIDVTGKEKPENWRDLEKVYEVRNAWKDFPRPAKFVYGA